MSNRMKFWLAIGTLALLCAIGIDQAARSQVTAIAPIASAVTVQNSVTTIVAANPTRRALLICNAGATNDVWIAPVNPSSVAPVTPAANGAGSLVLSRVAAAAAGVALSCLNVPGASVPQGAAPIPGLVTSGFAGITNAATSPVTVWEF